MMAPTKSDSNDAAVEPTVQALQRELAFLREQVAELGTIASENKALIKRVAQLEADMQRADIAKSGQAALAHADDQAIDSLLAEAESSAQAQHLKLDSQGAASVPSADKVPKERQPAKKRGTGKAASRDRASISLSTALTEAPEATTDIVAPTPTPSIKGHISIMIVGPRVFGPTWRHFRLREIADLLYGMPHDAAVGMVTGPQSDGIKRELLPFVKRYKAKIAQSSEFFLGDRKWSEAVRHAVDAFRPALIINSGIDHSSANLLADLSESGIKIVTYLAQDEIAALTYKVRLEERFEAAVARLLHRSKLVLVTSEWERQQLTKLVPAADGKIKVYLRGVDLTRFYPTAASREAKTRALFIADRAGVHSFGTVLDAARLLEKNNEIEFDLFSNSPGEPSGNVERHDLVLRTSLPSVYNQANCFILPHECHGFSQSLMEAMAMGLPCLVPAALSEELKGHGAAVYNDAASLSSQIWELHKNPEQQRQFGAAAAIFAKSRLARSRWADTLRTALNETSQRGQ
jgi:glycosyltransferase involved in cell wall biosynthesis